MEDHVGQDQLLQAKIIVGRPPTSWTQHERMSRLFGLQITVTTHTDGSAGYQVYVDGMLAAALPGSGSNALNATLANPQLLLDGGHPIFLQVPAQAAAYVSPRPHLVHSLSCPAHSRLCLHRCSQGEH